MAGQGRYVHSNGDVYTGDFLEGKMHGSGVFSYASGDTYSGQYDGGQVCGVVLAVR